MLYVSPILAQSNEQPVRPTGNQPQFNIRMGDSEMSDSDEDNHSTASSQRSVSSSEHSSDSSDDANISNDEEEEEVEEDEVEEEEKRARKRKRERKGAQRGPRKNISKGEEVSDSAPNPASSKCPICKVDIADDSTMFCRGCANAESATALEHVKGNFIDTCTVECANILTAEEAQFIYEIVYNQAMTLRTTKPTGLTRSSCG